MNLKKILAMWRSLILLLINLYKSIVGVASPRRVPDAQGYRDFQVLVHPGSTTTYINVRLFILGSWPMSFHSVGFAFCCVCVGWNLLDPMFEPSRWPHVFAQSHAHTHPIKNVSSCPWNFQEFWMVLQTQRAELCHWWLPLLLVEFGCQQNGTGVATLQTTHAGRTLVLVMWRCMSSPTRKGKERKKVARKGSFVVGWWFFDVWEVRWCELWDRRSRGWNFLEEEEEGRIIIISSKISKRSVTYLVIVLVDSKSLGAPILFFRSHELERRISLVKMFLSISSLSGHHAMARNIH